MKTEMNRVGMVYADLNRTQKRYVDALIERDPSLASANSITRKHLEKIHWQMMAERETGGPKLGWPNWMVRGETLGRAVYPFPGPEATPVSPNSPAKSAAAIRPRGKSKVGTIMAAVAAVQASLPPVDQEFLADLEKYGL